jgi:hypothetical protein
MLAHNINQTFRRGLDGRYKGYGLVILPKKAEAAPELLSHRLY